MQHARNFSKCFTHITQYKFPTELEDAKYSYLYFAKRKARHRDVKQFHNFCAQESKCEPGSLTVWPLNPAVTQNVLLACGMRNPIKKEVSNLERTGGDDILGEFKKCSAECSSFCLAVNCKISTFSLTCAWPSLTSSYPRSPGHKACSLCPNVTAPLHSESQTRQVMLTGASAGTVCSYFWCDFTSSF